MSCTFTLILYDAVSMQVTHYLKQVSRVVFNNSKPSVRPNQTASRCSSDVAEEVILVTAPLKASAKRYVMMGPEYPGEQGIAQPGAH